MKVLLSAYCCGAGVGSEPGVGWNLALAMSRFHDVTVLTPKAHEARNDAALAQISNSSLKIEYYELPLG